MNILILNWKDVKNPTAGGAELVTFEHAKRWVKAGHEVTWLASTFKDLKKEEEIEGIEIVRFGNIYWIYVYALFFYLFSGRRFDVVVDEVHGIPFFTPLYVRKPIIVLLHEVAGEIWDYMYSFPLNYIGKFLEKVYLFLYKSKHFWTDSEAAINELVSHGINKEKSKAIYCPSNLSVLSSPSRKNKIPTFVWVSRIVKMKGIENVLKAFDLIYKKYNNAQLFIIGDGDKSYVDYIKNDVVVNYDFKDRVKFLGFISEKEKISVLKSSHILLHASVKEGWGIVVIEAASQATPSVVYNVPGLSESVKNNVTGIVLKKNNPEELAKQAIILFENKEKYKKMQIESLNWAKSLNWDKSASLSLSLLSQI